MLWRNWRETHTRTWWSLATCRTCCCSQRMLKSERIQLSKRLLDNNNIRIVQAKWSGADDSGNGSHPDNVKLTKTAADIITIKVRISEVIKSDKTLWIVTAGSDNSSTPGHCQPTIIIIMHGRIKFASFGYTAVRCAKPWRGSKGVRSWYGVFSSCPSVGLL